MIKKKRSQEVKRVLDDGAIAKIRRAPTQKLSKLPKSGRFGKMSGDNRAVVSNFSSTGEARMNPVRPRSAIQTIDLQCGRIRSKSSS